MLALAVRYFMIDLVFASKPTCIQTCATMPPVRTSHHSSYHSSLLVTMNMRLNSLPSRKPCTHSKNMAFTVMPTLKWLMICLTTLLRPAFSTVWMLTHHGLTGSDHFLKSCPSVFHPKQSHSKRGHRVSP